MNTFAAIWAGLNADALDLSILGPAFCAGLIVLLTHVPLGTKVLARGIIFIDLAIAQVAALGAIAAQLFWHEPSMALTQLCAIVAALMGALLLTWSDRRYPDKQEALIGTLFVLAASAAILLIANNPHGGEQLKELLVGQILWVSWERLVLPALISAVLLALLTIWRERLSGFAFYALFALAITQSVQLVGVYLVFASLIVPALASDHLTGAKRLALAYSVGMLGYGLGLALSALSDLPSGAVIVWALAVSGLVLRLLTLVRRRSVLRPSKVIS